MQTQSASEAFNAARNVALQRVAGALENYLKRKRLSVKAFNEEVLKVGPKNTAIYGWLSQRNLPSAQYIPALASALHVGRWYFTPQISNGTAQDGPVDGAAGVAGGVAEAAVEPAEKTAEELLDELLELPETPPVSPVRDRVVHARNPRSVPRQGACKTADRPNFLSYQGHADGTATVVYTADCVRVQRLFVSLAQVGSDVIKIDEA